MERALWSLQDDYAHILRANQRVSKHFTGLTKESGEEEMIWKNRRERTSKCCIAIALSALID